MKEITKAEAEAARGAVFNIQHYSIHDGPGIRTTVFMKGCGLRCLWCQNPESLSLVPQIFFASEKCTGCGKCAQVCPERAIEIHKGRSRTNRKLCKGRGVCADACPNEARSLMGKYMTAAEVVKDVAGDAIFYSRSGGGVTLSGGDPLAQPRFSMSILKLCRDTAIHTAIETCGFAQWETVRELLAYVDLVLYDFKHMDPKAHKECTGVSNEELLDNVKKIHHELRLPILARVPVVTGFNDAPENIGATARFIATELGSTIRVHLLPYHRLGEAKYERLEEDPTRSPIEPPSDTRMEELQKIVESFGLPCQIGG